jgi:hypothetical protein
MNKFTLLASLAVLALATPAFADSKESVKASGTDAAGTTTSVDQSVKVKDRMDGTTDTTVTTETTKDPKGLMNKSKVKSKETVTTDQNGNVIKDTKSVDGKVVNETK